jgi:capsular exopolysaccharide synthesis family protein
MEIKENSFYPMEKFNDPLYSKQIKFLRSRVLHLIDSTRSNVIGITSAVDNEGKTTLAINLALSICTSADRSVLLVDADLIKCSITSKFGLRGAPGLSHFLNGNEKGADILVDDSGVIALWESGVKNLSVIPSGSPVDNSADLLIKNTFNNLVNDMRGGFDIVIVDLPPVVSTPDPASIKEKIDKFIFSYHTGKTPRGLLEDAMHEIGKERILGVVLNRANKEQMLKYGKQYYYYNKQQEVTLRLIL